MHLLAFLLFFVDIHAGLYLLGGASAGSAATRATALAPIHVKVDLRVADLIELVFKSLHHTVFTINAAPEHLLG